MGAWLDTPPGRYLLRWEQARVDALVSDIFGFHALQLGFPRLNSLRANRMPHRWLGLGPDEHVTPSTDRDGEGISPSAIWTGPDLKCDYHALPFPENSLDLVVLPHTLDFAADPHQTLREVERVLVPDGRVLVCGLNPMSLWGIRQRVGDWRSRLVSDAPSFVPGRPASLGMHRLRDWLRLLSFDVVDSEFGLWRLPLRSERGLERMRWLDTAGPRWWPVLGAAYTVTAVKRVRGMHMVGRARKLPTTPLPAPAVATSRAAEPVTHRAAS